VSSGEVRSAWLFMAPALGAIALVAVFPLAWTFWESLHLHDLHRGERAFAALDNYARALGDPRAVGALLRTVGFAGVSVALELVLGLALALTLDSLRRGRDVLRAASLLPWALPTVVAALVWRFLFEGSGSLASAVWAELGLGAAPVWLADPWLAWIPIVAADVWKTTPFVAILLLAGLQNVDPALREAARLDGASAWQELRGVVLPLLRPALVVAAVFRGLDALRVFDLVYVLTGGGPGTATEPLSLAAFAVLLQDLRFGYGSALSMVVFALSFGVALVGVRVLGADSGATPKRVQP